MKVIQLQVKTQVFYRRCILNAMMVLSCIETASEYEKCRTFTTLCNRVGTLQSSVPFGAVLLQLSRTMLELAIWLTSVSNQQIVLHLEVHQGVRLSSKVCCEQ
jgi:hypothetical protein